MIRFRFLLASLALLYSACGEAVVGTSPFANTPPTVDPIADVVTDEDVPATITVTMTDAEDVNVLVLSADSDNPALIDASGFTFGGSGGSRTFTLTPKQDQSGTATITLTVTDNDTFVPPVVLTFTFTVNAVNDPPVFAGLADVTVDEDGTVATTSFSVSDVDTPLASVTVSVANDNAALMPSANLTMTGPGTYTYGGTLVPDGNGVVTLTFSADDGTDIGTFPVVITVNAVNDAPTIGAVADLAIDEDVASGPIAFTVADVDDAAGTLTLTATSSDPTVIPVANVTFGGSAGARTFDVISAQDAFGSSTITITVSDGRLTATETFVVTVNPVNDAPVIAALADVTTDEDVNPPTVAITISDVDDPVGSLVLTGTSSDPAVVAAAGLAFAGTTGSRTLDVTLVPNGAGATLVTVTVTDPSGLTAQASYTLTVTALNDVPTITAIADQTTNEDTAIVGLSFTVADVETAAGSLLVTATSSDPSVVADADLLLGGAGGARTLTIAPRLNASGTTTVTLTVTDGTDSSSVSFVVTVVAVNDAPTITAIANDAVEEDTPSVSYTFSIADVDTPLANLAVSATSSDGTIVDGIGGGLQISGTAPNLTLTVFPIAQINGATTITVTVDDGALTASSPFVFTVTPLNDPPVIDPVSDVVMDEDTVATVDITFTDIDTPGGSVTFSATSSDPTVIDAAGISFTVLSPNVRRLRLQPIADAFGTTQIVVTADDGVEISQITFTVTVNPINDAPTITAIADANIQEDSSTGPILFTVSDVDDPVAGLGVTASSSDAALVPTSGLVLGGTNPSRDVTVTPVADGFGFADITISVTDGTLTTVETFRVNVASVNDPTIISAIADLTTSEDVATSAIAFTLTDVDDDVCLLTPVFASSDGTVIDASGATFGGSCGARTVILTPVADASGVANVEVRVTDSGATVVEPFVLTVNAVEDAPRISAIADATILEDATHTVAFTIVDPDLPPQTLTVMISSDNTALVPNGNLVLGGSGTNRTLDVTPSAEASGAATITISVSDGTTTTTETFVLTVTAIDDPPIISVIADVSLDEDSTTSVSFTVTDPDSTPTVSAAAADTTLLPVAGGLVLSGTLPSQSLAIAPATDAFGNTTITVTAMDGTSTVTATFTVTVRSINDLPTIGAIVDQTTAEDVANAPITLVLSDVETACDALVITVSSSDTSILTTAGVSVTGTCPNRQLVLNPVANANGTTIVTVSVTDGDGATVSTAPFDLVVTPADDPPIAGDDSFTTTGNVTLTGQTLAGGDSDPDGDALSFATGTTSLNGGVVTLLDAATGTFTYTPPPGFRGTDQFTYTLLAGGDADTGLVTITVTGPMIWFVDNAAPTSGANGTDVHPFTTLAALSATAAYVAGGDVQVWIYEGDGTSAGYDTNFLVKDDVTVIGVDRTATGNPPIGNPPILSVTGGTALTMSNRGTVQGVRIETCTLGIDAIGGSGTVRFVDVQIVGCATGIDIDGSNAASGAILDGVSIEGASVVGLHIRDVAAQLNETTGPNSVRSTSGSALFIEGSTVFAAGSTLDVLELVGTTCTTGILANSSAASPGTLTFGTIDIETTGTCNAIDLRTGTFDLGVASTVVVGEGFALRSATNADVSGDLQLLDCTSTTGTCVSIVGSAGTVTVTDLQIDSTGQDGVVIDTAGFVVAGGDVAVSGGVALDFDTATGDVTLDSLVGSNGGAVVSRIASSGALTVGAVGGARSSLDSTSGNGVFLNSAGTVSFTNFDLVSTGVYGFEIRGSGSLALADCDVDGDTGANDAAIHALDSTVAISLTDCVVRDAERLIDLDLDGTGTSSSFTALRTVFRNAEADCIRAQPATSHALTMDLTGTLAGAEMTLCGTSGGTADYAIDFLDGTSGASVLRLHDMDIDAVRAGVRGLLDTGGTDTLLVERSTFTNSVLDVLTWSVTQCSARSTVDILDSTVGILGTQNSGATDGSGFVLSVVASSPNCSVDHRIENNGIYGVQFTDAAGISTTYDLDTGNQSSILILDNIDDLTDMFASNAFGMRMTAVGNALGPCYRIQNNTFRSVPKGAVASTSGTGAGSTQIEGYSTSLLNTLTSVANGNTISGTVTETGGHVAPAGGTCPNL